MHIYINNGRKCRKIRRRKETSGTLEKIPNASNDLRARRNLQQNTHLRRNVHAVFASKLHRNI